MARPATIIPAKRRVGRKRRRPPAAPTPPAALVLVSAAYDHAGPNVTLTFDRQIDVAGIDVTAVTVNDDDVAGIELRGAGAVTLTGPAAVRIPLADVGIAQQPGTFLTATAATGIVAADDGGTWAGATGLALPYP